MCILQSIHGQLTLSKISLFTQQIFPLAGSFSDSFNHWIPSKVANKTEPNTPSMGILPKLRNFENDTISKAEHMLKDNNELKAKASNATVERNALLGKLKQQLNETVSKSQSVLPASKGQLQEQGKKIDEQDIIINELVKQINALTPVSGIASAL